MQPQTVWEERDGVKGGGGAMIRAAAFDVDGQQRGAVTLTVQALDGFWMALEGGAGVNATIALNPSEARGFAAWLDEAADAAESVGPPYYG